MSHFIFPPLTASLDSEQTNGGSLPAKQMVVAGYDSTATRVLLTDSAGRLEINAVVSLPLPSGAATAALQTAGNNLLTTIDADTSILAGAVSGTEMQVDVVSSALPSGAATSALQTSGNNLLTTIDADTSALAGAISGTEMQVDIVASLPAGTNNIGDVDIASALPAGTNNIGDVDIASALPAGTNTIGGVDIASALPAGTNNIGDVDIASALPAGTNTIGKVDVNAIAPVDFLDSGIIDTSTAAISTTGTTVVSSLASACTEIEVVDDIGEYMSLRVGGVVKAYLPLGGGRVKVTLAATNAVQLYSEIGSNITSGKIAINFLG